MSISKYKMSFAISLVFKLYLMFKELLRAYKCRFGFRVIVDVIYALSMGRVEQNDVLTYSN